VGALVGSRLVIRSTGCLSAVVISRTTAGVSVIGAATGTVSSRVSCDVRTDVAG
jgi:hypothetical protein